MQVEANNDVVAGTTSTLMSKRDEILVDMAVFMATKI